MADEFRVITGVVQFEPKEAEAGGKAVRNLAVRQTGVKDQNMRVSATLWPSHASVEVSEGDAVVLEGKFTRNKGTKTVDGEEVAVVYNNLSVTGILVLGPLEKGTRSETVNDESVPDDDDVPY